MVHDAVRKQRGQQRVRGEAADEEPHCDGRGTNARNRYVSHTMPARAAVRPAAAAERCVTARLVKSRVTGCSPPRVPAKQTATGAGVASFFGVVQVVSGGKRTDQLDTRSSPPDPAAAHRWDWATLSTCESYGVAPLHSHRESGGSFNAKSDQPVHTSSANTRPGRSASSCHARWLYRPSRTLAGINANPLTSRCVLERLRWVPLPPLTPLSRV